MSKKTALAEMEVALKEYRSTLEEKLVEASTFVDLVGASLLHADLMEVSFAIEIGLVSSGSFKVSDNLSLTFIKGVLKNANYYPPKSDNSNQDSLFGNYEPRKEAVELLLNLSGVPCSLFDIYQVNYGLKGESPKITSLVDFNDDLGISLSILSTAEYLVEEKMLDSTTLLTLENESVEVLMEMMKDDSEDWSVRLIKEDESWL
jgi:hypothetical protein